MLRSVKLTEGGFEKRFLACLAGLAVPAIGGTEAAEDPGGPTVVIPVAVHGRGKLGAVWVTDVWVSNHSSVEKTVTPDFYPTSGGHLTSTVQIVSWGAVELDDSVLDTIGLDNARGWVAIQRPG